MLLTNKVLAAVVALSLLLVDALARGVVLLQEGLNLSAAGNVRIETVILITSTIVGLATAYLRLYVGSEVGKQRRELTADLNTLKADLTTMFTGEIGKLKAELVSKEVHDLKIKAIEQAVDTLRHERGREGEK